MAKFRRQKISYVVQAKTLERTFPKGKLSMNHNGFKWVASLTPSPLSATYKIKLHYQTGFHPRVYVLDKLALAEGKDRLPHVYSTKEQYLCLYHRSSGQWHSGMLICDTVIPWTHEWLYFYEYWLIDGIWYGGGIGHEKKKPYKKNELSDL